MTWRSDLQRGSPWLLPSSSASMAGVDSSEDGDLESSLLCLALPFVGEHPFRQSMRSKVLVY